MSGGIPAGHGVHRSESIDGVDPETQCTRAASSSSAPSRFRVNTKTERRFPLDMGCIAQFASSALIQLRRRRHADVTQPPVSDEPYATGWQAGFAK